MLLISTYNNIFITLSLIYKIGFKVYTKMSNNKQHLLSYGRYIFKVTKIWKEISLAIIAALLVGGASYLYISNHGSNKTIHQSTITESSINSKPTEKKTNSTAISHIFIIVDENKPSDTIVGNSQAPYINSLINTYAFASNYSGVTHPSLPNYLALTSGSTDGITTDCNPPGAGCIVNVLNIADEIQASGRTWKAYAESMPSPCYMLNSGSDFATKHVPFLYYKDIVNNSSLCNSHIVPFSQLSSDLKSISTTPNYAFITPNLCNDMHSCSVAVGDAWLAKYVPMILNSKAFQSQRSLLVITWDEGYVGNNVVPAIFAGSAAKKGYKSSAPYNHYSLLHTIEQLWGLRPLNSNDANAPIMTSFIN